MTTYARRTAVSLFAGAALLAGAAVSPASAATQTQDGLVNVAVGDIDILRDARVAVAAQVIAQICNVKVGPIVVLGRAVDRGALTDPVCTVQNTPVTISQN